MFILTTIRRSWPQNRTLVTEHLAITVPYRHM